MAELHADVNGHLAGSFLIPPNVPCGVKSVNFRGHGGTVGFAQYTAYGWKTFLQKEHVTDYLITHYDPVGQTLPPLSEARQATGVDIKFTAIGDRSKPVSAQLRTLENGWPTATVVAQGTFDMHNAVICDPLSARREESDWARINFEVPALMREGTNYGVVLLTDDPDHAVAIADLGGFDQVSGHITVHPFLGGTFVEGSDNRTWLPHMGRALLMRFRAAKFTTTQRVIEFGEIEVTGATDLMTLVLAERPEGTAVEVEFELPDGAKFLSDINTGVPLPFAVTGKVSVRLRLTGTAKLSPVLFPTIQVVVGTLSPEGDYVSRAFKCWDDGYITAVVDCDLPGSAKFDIYAQVAADDDNNPIWQPMTLRQATPQGDGIVEHEYALDHVSTDLTRIKIDLHGNPASRPRLTSFRGAVTKSTTGDL